MNDPVSMDMLKRHLAPFESTIWSMIEEEAGEALKQQLIGRRVIDVESPKGLEFSALNTGVRESIGTKKEPMYMRQSLPVFEVMRSFEISKEDIEDIYRGGHNLKELDSLQAAAKSLAQVENQLIFQGVPKRNLPGLYSGAEKLKTTSMTDEIVAKVVKAAEMMMVENIEGPFKLLMSYDDYAGIMSASAYPLTKKLLSILGEESEILLDPQMKDQVAIISARGGDYKLHLGCDVSIGYQGETQSHVQLFFFESCTFEVITPEACILIK